MADQETTTTRTPAQLRDAALEDLDRQFGGLTHAQRASAAQAALVLDMIDARHQAAPPAPAPPFDVDELIVDVWNATQEAGASTAIGDAAIEAIRSAVRIAGAPGA